MSTTACNTTSDRSRNVDYPGSWNEEDLRRQWIEQMKVFARESEIAIPLKRILFQVEQSAEYQDTLQRWPKMQDHERLLAWKSLLEASERIAQEILPACVQCGECCRKSSPTLNLDDMELLRSGRIPWSELVTLRRGEPVVSPFQEKLFFLLDERVKLREKPGTSECVFLDSASDQCLIYVDRPTQCRAQACWDEEPAKELAQQPYLARRDILQNVDLLLDLVVEHDRRCSFEKLNAAFKRLEESHGKTVDEVLELLAYENHFRTFFRDQFKIPEDTLDLVFGRSFAELVSLFGFRVVEEQDGTRCLVTDRS